MTETKFLTINARGEIKGDTSHIPAETLEKLNTPESRQQMRAMYRQEFGTGRRETAALTHREPKAAQRDYRYLCPPGMDSREFRKVRRKFMRERTKAALKSLRAS